MPYPTIMGSLTAIVTFLMASSSVFAADCSFSNVCIDEEKCESIDFQIDYEHTGYDSQLKHQKATMRIPSLPWIPIYLFEEPRSVNGYLANADNGERQYFFTHASTGFMLSVVEGRAILAIHAMNGNHNPSFAMAHTYFGQC